MAGQAYSGKRMLLESRSFSAYPSPAAVPDGRISVRPIDQSCSGLHRARASQCRVYRPLTNDNNKDTRICRTAQDERDRQTSSDGISVP